MTITVEHSFVSRHPDFPEVPDIRTVVVRYPRFIHAEVMTHRVFSRNASSSRAIPVERMILDVLEDPAMPVSWGSNRPGMQAGEEIDEFVLFNGFDDDGDWVTLAHGREDAWLAARDRSVEIARGFVRAGYHKQVVNRLLEPFAHITVMITGTEWQNFFDLRCHEAADPTMRALAEAIREAFVKTEVVVLERGQWHTPMAHDVAGPLAGDRIVSSVASAARVSYDNHDMTVRSMEKDLKLHDQLRAMRHLSPFEHQAQAVTIPNGHRNFAPGWRQYRSIVE